ncbi:MAG TPA: adenylate/guanylate cyclase domain-containing protein [Verrucomicrobiota bacterium]|nr:adenylate/guanylate cyclase domain-containing protein [Verrucomicrobiota bacterium]HNU50585.1 adenylate/guanylate cyclase domain-containing protein [Verrucomicrobiota bacterium]
MNTSTPAPAPSARILIVDDTPANLQTLAAVLKEQGYQISVATNGQQALDALGKIQPDLVLMDVMMPVMDGYEACRQIKTSALWKDLPVIFLTSKNDTADIVRGFQLGAVDYVAKPFNPCELLARVHTHLTLDRLNKENQRLLLNVLPAPIAERLKKQPGIIAERFDDVSVLFADIVGFTHLSARLAPTDLIALLNRVFSRFDELVEHHGLEKIKTIGDAYMVAGGLPNPQPDHLERMIRLALDIQAAASALSADSDNLALRIGLHAGSVVAGVIGIRKFIYDIWGDTVNTASRLESHGLPGRIQVTESLFHRIQAWCPCEPRGVIDVKGKGPLRLYLVVGP